MPQSVAAAPVPTQVIPALLMRSWERSQEWSVQANIYANGETQVSTEVTTPRRRWRLSNKLTAAQLTALRTLYFSVKCQTPVYFYDGHETSPKWSTDATGVSATGRYTVVFVGEWNERHELGGLYYVDLEIVEVA